MKRSISNELILGCRGVITVLGFLYLRDNPNEPVKASTKGMTSSRFGAALGIFGDRGFFELFHHSMILVLGITYLLFGVCLGTSNTFFVSFLKEELHLPLETASWIWLWIGFVAIFGGLFWGFLSDHLGRKLPIIASFFMLALAMIIPVTLKSELGTIASALLLVASFKGGIVINSALVGDVVVKDMASIVLGAISLLFGIGLGLGPFFTGYIADKSGSFCVPFLISFTLMLFWAFLLLLIKQPNQPITVRT